MVLEALVSTLSSVLAPYLAKGGEAFAKEAGKDAAAGVKSLYEAVKSRLLVDPKSKQALTRIEQSPDAAHRELPDLLRGQLAGAPDRQGYFQHLIDKLPPQISVMDGGTRTLIFDRSAHTTQTNTATFEKNQTTNNVAGNQTNNNVGGNQTNNYFHANRDVKYKA